MLGLTKLCNQMNPGQINSLIKEKAPKGIASQTQGEQLRVTGKKETTFKQQWLFSKAQTSVSRCNLKIFATDIELVLARSPVLATSSQLNVRQVSNAFAERNTFIS